MNNVSLYGRLVRDPEIRYTQGENPVAVARFTVAVDRPVSAGKEREADFISCEAWGKTAGILEKYFHKGNRITATGSIRTGSYTNRDGVKVYTTDVSVARIGFVESSNENSGQTAAPAPADSDGFMSILNGVKDEGLPFN
jgi:single-strand DNA-binding protein